MYPNSMSDQSGAGGPTYPLQPGKNYGYITPFRPQPANPLGYGDQAELIMRAQNDQQQQQQASIEKIRALEAQSRRSGPIQQTDAPPRLY